MIRRSAPNQLKSLLVRVNGISAQISHCKYIPFLILEKLPLAEHYPSSLFISEILSQK